jgi:hypothetical protein
MASSSLAERLNGVQKIMSSNPTAPTIFVRSFRPEKKAQQRLTAAFISRFILFKYLLN